MGVRYISLLTIVSSLVLFTFGCGNKPTYNVSNDASEYPEAVRIYQNVCVNCHGSSLEGGEGPDLRHIGKQMSKAEIVHQITEGGGAMPAFGPLNILTDAQIQQVADWLETKQ